MIQSSLLRGLLLLFVVLNAKCVHASPADVQMRLGDSAYARKSYDSALHYYTQAASGPEKDPVILFKLGNANYRLNRLGEAVLAYERALLLRPGFADAAENIALIQRRIQPNAGKSDVFFVRWWKGVTKPSWSNGWAILGVICFCVPLVVLIRSRLLRKWPTWLWPHVVVGGIALSLLFALLSAVSVKSTSGDTGVIMRQDAIFATGENARGKGVVSLPEGLVVKVLRNDAGGMRVRLPDGREGVVQRSDIALVK